MDDTLHTVPINVSSLMALLLRAPWQNVLSSINLQRFQEENPGGIKPESCHWAGWRRKHVVLFVLHLSSLVRGRRLAGLWQQLWIRKWWSVGGIHPQTHSLTPKSCYKAWFLAVNYASNGIVHVKYCTWPPSPMKQTNELKHIFQ